MPVLPDPNTFQRTRFQPSGRIVQMNPDPMGQALEGAGRMTERTSERAQNFLDMTAELQARDALTQLKRVHNQLTVGEQGYARLQNGDALAPGVVPDYQSRHRTAVEQIGETMNPLARQKFERAAQEMGHQFEAGLMNHILREDLAFRGEVYKGQLSVAAETMALNYNNPEVILRERQNIDRASARYFDLNGITEPDVQEHMLREARGQGHAAVIRAYLDNDDAKTAEQYLHAVRDEIPQAKAKALQKMLKPEIAGQLGREVADRLYSMHLDGVPESQIFEEKLKLTEGRGLDVVRAADAIYEDRKRALDEDRTRQSGAILLDVLKGAPGINDPRLRDIEQADPVLAVRVRDQIRTIQKRNAVPAGGSPAPATMDNMALYAQIADKIRTEGMTSEAIVQHATTLPKADIKSLLNLQAGLDKEAAKYRLPVALINEGIPRSALKDTERKNAYKGFVERQLQDWKEANPGKTPTPEEAKEIVRSASQEHVEVGRFWNSKVEAYQAEGRKTYPRAFGQLLNGYDDDDIIQAYAFAQRFRAKMARNDAPITDAEIIKLWEQNRKN